VPSVLVNERHFIRAAAHLFSLDLMRALIVSSVLLLAASAHPKRAYFISPNRQFEATKRTMPRTVPAPSYICVARARTIQEFSFSKTGAGSMQSGLRTRVFWR
jgi:hypothetical protein